MANDVFYFNPTCELAVANGSFSYMPPKLLREFEQDCSILPFIFGTSSDFVLTEEKPSTDFIHKLSDVGFEMPEFCSIKEMAFGKTDSLNSIFPWGWSPAAHFILNDLKERGSSNFHKSPVFTWNENHKMLYERMTSLHFLDGLLKQNSVNYFIEPEMTGTKVTRLDEIENLMNQHIPLVLKAPLSSSGRGIQIIRKPILNTSKRQWISGILNQQKYLIAEPFLEKLADISFQFNLNSAGEPEYSGYSVFETNTNGQYKSTLIHPGIREYGFSEIYKQTEEMIGETAMQLKEALKQSVYIELHRGFLGIDAMIYQDKKELKIQPCVEINCRMNMGILTMFIEKKIDQDTTGKFELFYGSKGEYQRFVTEKISKNHLKTRNGKLSAGFLPLVEPTPEKQFGAYITLETAKY